MEVSMPPVEGLESKIIEEVYRTILKEQKTQARKRGRSVEDAEDIASETIIRMLESHLKEPIENPLHWARHTAKNISINASRRSYRHISYSGVEGITEDGATIKPRQPEEPAENTPYSGNTWTREKRTVPHNLAKEIAETVIEDRSPEEITLQRDLLQKIDPEWEAHMEEGYDFESGKKMDRNTRRRIKRRAQVLLDEEVIC